MKPQSCKAKGRRLQQKIVADIVEAFPHLQPDDVLSTSMGCGGEDIRMSPLARNSLPLSIEAKNQEKLNIWDAYSQASKNCSEELTPCVVFKKNHTEMFAMLPWKTLLNIYVQLGEKGNGTTPKRALELLEELNSLLKPDITDEC